MSGHYHKVKHQRMKKSTHFQEVNVTMQPLNDPILPKHPGSPDPSLKSRSDKSLFHNIDLSEIVVSGRPSTRTSDRHGNRDSNVYRSSRSETTKSAPSLYPHSASNNEYESHSPYSKSQLDEFEELPVKFALSQKTRRLLQEVDNISKMYLTGNGEMLDLDDNSSAPDKQVSSPTNLYSEKENSGKGTRPVSKRTKVYCEVSDDLVSNIGRNKIAVKRSSPEPEKIDPETLASVKVRKVEYEDKKRSSSKRANHGDLIFTKYKHGMNEAAPSTVESANKPLESKKEKVSTDKSEEEIKVTVEDLKPWRKNMKKSDEKDPMPSSPTKCTCPRSQDPEVRNYIKAKRKLKSQQDKKKAKENQESISKIKDALLALDVWRKKNAQKIVENAQKNVEDKNSKSLKLQQESLADDYVRKEKNLRGLLEKLTTEMRSKYCNEELITDLIVNAKSEHRDTHVVLSPSIEVKANNAPAESPPTPLQRGRRPKSTKLDQRADIEDRLRKFVSTRYTSPSKQLPSSGKISLQPAGLKSPKSPGKLRQPAKKEAISSPNRPAATAPVSKSTKKHFGVVKSVKTGQKSAISAEKVFETAMTQTQSQMSDEVDSMQARRYLMKNYPQLVEHIEKVKEIQKDSKDKEASINLGEEAGQVTKDHCQVYTEKAVENLDKCPSISQTKPLTRQTSKSDQDVSEKSQGPPQSRLDFESLKLIKTTFAEDIQDNVNRKESNKNVSSHSSITKNKINLVKSKRDILKESQTNDDRDPVSRQSTYASISLGSSKVEQLVSEKKPQPKTGSAGGETLDPKRKSSQAPDQMSGSDLRSKVESLQERHRHDMKLIRNSNINIFSQNTSSKRDKLSDPDIANPPPSTYQTSHNSKMSAKLGSASSAPDPFNFISTVQRKMEDDLRRMQNITDESRVPISEYSVGISEGPLSITTQSSTHSKHEKSNERRQKTSDQKQSDALFVPAALQLRFQAELNQMEGIQEAERQLNSLNHIREVVTARNDAAAIAQMFRQGLGSSFPAETSSHAAERSRKSRSSSIGGETRAEFEARMKLYVEELLNKRTKDLLHQQTEATKATADAAKQLSRIFRSSKHKSPISVRGSELSNDLLTLMSKTDSKFTEVMSVAEKTEKSGSSIQKTISEAIRTLSADDPSTNSIDITEDIAADLSSTVTDVVPTVVEQEKTSTFRKARHASKGHKKKQHIEEFSESSSSEKCSTQTSSIESFSKFAGKLSFQNCQEQLINLQHKLTMFDNKEKLLDERFKREMSKAQDENASETRQQKLVHNYRHSKAEFGPLRSSLKAEIRDIKFYISQQKKLARDSSSNAYKQDSIDIERYLSPSPTTSASLSMASNESKAQKPSNGSKNRTSRLARLSGDLKLSIGGGPPFKMPLSPNSTGKSRIRNLSGPESDDSIIISQVETVSDHSDLEVCISAIESDLRGCIRQSEKLKRGNRQRSYNSDQLKLLEESRIQQITALDMIITSKKAELDEVLHQQGQRSPVVQPIIKTPKSSGRFSFGSQASVESIEPGDNSQRTVSSMSGASSTDTIMASPKKIVSEDMHEFSIELSSGSLDAGQLANGKKSIKPHEDFGLAAENITLELTSPKLEIPIEKGEDIQGFEEPNVSEGIRTELSNESKGPDDSRIQTDITHSIGEGGDVEESEVAESIQEIIESTSLPVESELNYSDDFTSSSASELTSTNLVIKTTVLARPKPILETNDKDEKHSVNELLNLKDSDKNEKDTTCAKKSKDELVVVICDSLFDEILHDTFNMIFKVKHNLTLSSKNNDQSKASKEIKLQKSSVKKSVSPSTGPSKTPIQNLMLTTFDVSSDSSQESGSEDNVQSPSVPTFEFDKPLEGFSEIDHGDFIDDDFGLSIRQESEKLRQQQLLVEQEISRIQQEERDIPDKPPPPYTPPASTRVLRARPAFETPKYVPSSKQDLANLVPGMVISLLASNHSIHAKLRKDFKENPPIDTHDMTNFGPSRQKFVSFLNDLVADIFNSIYKVEREVQNPPWLPQKPLEKQRLSLPSSESMLISRVLKEVHVAFHYEKRAGKENLVVRWSQKRRDRVDQILVRELHSEETSWTDYSADEVIVKNQMADNILDGLLADTAQAFSKIFGVREKPVDCT